MFKWKAEIEGDRIRFLGEEYPLGHFCLELLQRALVDDAAQRVAGSVAAAAYAVEHGAVVARVHDVAQTAQAFRLFAAILSA